MHHLASVTMQSALFQKYVKYEWFKYEGGETDLKVASLQSVNFPSPDEVQIIFGNLW